MSESEVSVGTGEPLLPEIRRARYGRLTIYEVDD